MSPTPAHDTRYKELFSHPEFVQQLLEGFAPKAISELLDYRTLKNHPGHYITPLFEEKVEDAVWSVQLKLEALQPSQPVANEPAKPVTVYLYILMEFQSRVDRSMPLRMVHYVASFYHQLLKAKEIKLKDGLPPVFPIVLYNGDSQWHVPDNLQSLIQKVPVFLQKFQPQLHYFLVDEKRLPQAVLDQSNSPLGQLFALEQADSRHDVLRVVTKLVETARQHPNRERISRVLQRWIAHYLHNQHPSINLGETARLEEIPGMIGEGFKKERMQWKEEGIQAGIQLGLERGIEKGIEKGIEQGAHLAEANAIQKLLHRGVAPEQVADWLEVPLSRVQEIAAKENH